jgi:AraC-like DNA-binding protein
MPLNAGQVYLIPSWVRFQCSAVRPVMQNFLHFYLTGLPPTLLRRFFPRPLRLPRDETITVLCRRWRAGLDDKPAFPPLGWAATLAQAAVILAMEQIPPAEQAASFRALSGFSPINPALRCIEERLSRPPENAELARLCHFSTDHFIRQFHFIAGMTPAKYGLERRLASAARWLTSSNRTLEEIADQAGFTDRFHFSRSFKARLGLPPAAYRRLHRVDAREG